MKSPGRRWNRVLIAATICSMGLALTIPPPPGGRLRTQQQRDRQQAQENARGEQAMAAKRLEAFLRDEAMPHPCQLFVEWSPRLYAIAIGPAAEQTGLRRGDRIKTINAENLATLDDVKRILTSLPVGVSSVHLIVERTALMLERESRDVSLHGRCRSDRARWEAKKKALEAMKDGRWNDCFLGMREVIQEWGGGLTGDIEVRGLCAYYDAPLKAQPIGPAYAQRPHAWRRAQIAEARYDPGALDRVRGDVLTGANVLRSWNAKNLAEDLEHQLKEAAMRTKFDPDGDSSHAQGTGVLARPDGTLLTAAHVVHRAKHIVVHCPGRKEAVGRTKSVARSLDLAVVRTSLANTAYLSLYPAMSARMGESFLHFVLYAAFISLIDV